MSDSAATLREITNDNWREVCRLKLADGQENWVAPNWYSIIEAHFEGHISRAIYAGDTVVGYALYTFEEAKKQAYIIRLMTDKDQQAKGYGRAAIQQIIADCKTRPFVENIYISFVPGNDIARKLYLSVGFIDTGEFDDGEHVFKLPVER